MSINIKFPIEDDVIKKTMVKVNILTKNAVSSNLMLLLLTEKGSRYYMPEYGTNLLKYIFEPIDDITIADIEDDIRTTVKHYISEIDIVKITMDKPDENKLIVNIYYSYVGISGAIEQIQLEF